MRAEAWIVFVFAFIAEPFASAQAPKVIYGPDDRLDLYEIRDPTLLRLARSTVALFPADRVTVDRDIGIATLSLVPYGQEYRLCQDEPFYSQKLGAFCSGSLVAPDLVLTAGHCIRKADECTSVRFVFGFGLHREGESLDTLPADAVYGCTEVVGHAYEGSGADYSVVRLDRSVTDRAPLEINRSGALATGTPLFVIGHPAGLPTKVAGGAVVRKSKEEGYFVANLDTYGGNSGSAVFNAATGQIEGVLVRGVQDFVSREGAGCRVSYRCADHECNGEEITRAVHAAKFIPESR